MRQEIDDWVNTHHEHAPDMGPGYLWAYGLWIYEPRSPLWGTMTFGGRGRDSHWPETLIGVVVVGRPKARVTEQKAKAAGLKIAEVSRVALDRTRPGVIPHKTSSGIYERVAEDAAIRGFDVVQTHTLHGVEDGMSLRYARWKHLGTGEAKKSWHTPSRPRKDRPEILHVPKDKWGIGLTDKGKAYVNALVAKRRAEERG